MTNDFIYADYAAATPTDSRVIAAMQPYFSDIFANPSSAHAAGQKTANAAEGARKVIADFINANPEEIYFTASGTESNNLAVLGVSKANNNKGRHIVTTKIEHPSILNVCRALERDDWEITYLDVNESGEISYSELEESLTTQTVLLSIHYGNSEIGTLPDLKKISEICKNNDVLFHVDACQALSYEKIDVQEMGIDLLTFNGSKMYGPKGVAVLYVRYGVDIFPIIYGGGQQKSLRSGTENVPGIVGIAKAVEIIERQCEDDKQTVFQLRNDLETQLEALGLKINAKNGKRLPNHLSVVFPNLKNVDVVKIFNEQGIAISAGSACSSSSIVESDVLRAIDLSSEEIQATIRITIGRETTKKDCDQIVAICNKLLSERI
jgi:cysteine desulfurase